MSFVSWMLGAVGFCFSLISCILISQGYIVLDVLDRVLVKLELKLVGKYDCVPVDGESVASGHNTRASWQLKKDNVSVFAIQGRRARMEDRFNVVTNMEHTGTSIYGIFDGHGGEFAADFTEKTLFKLIMIKLLRDALSGSTNRDMASLLNDAVLTVDQQLVDVGKLMRDKSGTTALVALHHGNKLFVANVGDSRGILCDRFGNVTPLSFDHKPNQESERRRIKAAGGFVSFNGVWRVSGILATSRALGDYPLKDRRLIISDPDIRVFDLDELQPSFIVLATDGLWDTFSNDEVCAYIRERLTEPHFGAKSIVLQAFYRGSLDNITVLVVNFAPSEQKDS